MIRISGLDIDFDSIKTEAGLGVGGNERIKEMEEAEYQMAA